jgi:hypothetical protein
MRWTWNAKPSAWIQAMRVVLASMALFVSACTTPGHSNSSPAAIPAEGGQAGTVGSGNGDGGNDM